MKLFITLDLEKKGDLKPKELALADKVQKFSMDVIKEYGIPVQMKITNLPLRKRNAKKN